MGHKGWPFFKNSLIVALKKCIDKFKFVFQYHFKNQVWKIIFHIWCLLLVEVSILFSTCPTQHVFQLSI